MVKDSIAISEFGLILQDCRMLKAQFQFIPFRWISRSANKAAHVLIREALAHADYTCYSSLTFIYLILISDVDYYVFNASFNIKNRCMG